VVFGWVLQLYARRVVDQQVALARAAASARVAERARITQELHDIVAHSLSAIVLQAAGARAVNERVPGGNERVGQALTAIEDSGGQAMRELHRLLGLLRGSRSSQPDSQEPVTRKLDEMSELVETTRAAGLNVTMETTGTPRPLDPSVEHAAYRLLQEGLTNAMKHAGIAGRVHIDQTWSARRFDITVRSYDGAGKPALPTGGHGLVNLSERVHLVGGTFEAMPLPDGFLLKAQFPG
jgi:signal transduction histidine kinase